VKQQHVTTGAPTGQPCIHGVTGIFEPVAAGLAMRGEQDASRVERLTDDRPSRSWRSAGEKRPYGMRPHSCARGHRKPVSRAADRRFLAKVGLGNRRSPNPPPGW
jgi:hypothetical protein